MRKGPGFIARHYSIGRRKFLEAAKGYRIRTPQPASIMGAYTVNEERVRAAIHLDFEAAAGRTLAAVSADPRNHFGKHALRRFEND